MLMKKEIIEDNKKLKEEIERLKKLYETDRVSASEIIVEQDKKIKRLEAKNRELSDGYNEEFKENARLNNIINELEHDFESYEFEYLQETYQGSLADFIETELQRIRELKGEDKE